MLDIGSEERPHDGAEALLPWYATGQLDDSDRQLVEQHLQSCASCQRQLFAERRLIEEFRDLSPQVDSAWGRLRSRIEAPTPKPRPKLLHTAVEVWTSLTRPRAMAFVAAQALFFVLGGGLLLSMNRPPAPVYHALGSPPAPAAVNLLVIFREETTEGEMRAALERSHASIVGGPTSADAYLLHAPGAQRQSALLALRANRHVEMAQPIDGPAPS